MAVRLRSVAATDGWATGRMPSYEDALKPSSRIMGGRLADKLGSRMGLRLSGQRLLPEQQPLALFDDQPEPRVHTFGRPTLPTARA